MHPIIIWAPARLDNIESRFRILLLFGGKNPLVQERFFWVAFFSIISVGATFNWFDPIHLYMPIALQSHGP